MNKIDNVLIIGYGSMGRRRIRLIEQLDSTIQIACVDNNIYRVEQASKDGYRAFSSIEEALITNPKVAFVCTAPGKHADIIIDLIDKGIHVFTELNLTHDKYNSIKKKSEENHVVVFLSSTMLYKRQMQLFKNEVKKQSKELAYAYHVGQYLPDWHPWDDYRDLFFAKEKTNAIREIMAIQLPWIIDTFGRIKDVKVSKQNCTDLEIRFPDTVVLKMEHDNGNIGAFVVDVTSRKAMTSLEIIGEDIHIIWGGHNDDLLVFDIDSQEMKQVVLYEEVDHIEGYSDNIIEEPYKEEIKEFFSSIDGEPALYGIDEDEYVLNLIDKIERQYRDGAIFNLDKFINKYVTKRPFSMFSEDINANREQLYKGLHNKAVLVIGGAGSIGSSFIRAILPYELSELVVVDTNENALTELTRSLRSSKKYCSLIPDIYLTYPMDYSSIVFERMFTNHRKDNGEIGFDIVANFSAHKHVRSEKDIYSIEALLRNNVINAKKLLDLLEKNPPETFFCVSTDKAANPVNIMGASKRIMEDLIFSYSDSFPVKTARFANVAFSNGSLPAGFLDRISLRQPLSAPGDVKRYFVSPEESGQICMLSAMLGGNRNIFFPKLEHEQMSTFDKIAEDLLVSMGYDIDYCDSDSDARRKSDKWTEGQPYPVYFDNSNTSGEKSYEEFYIEGESVDLDRFKSLGIITDKNAPSRDRVVKLIAQLDDVFSKGNCTKEEIVRILASYLPSFNHIETGKNLDEKM